MSAAREHLPLAFFALLFALTVPFWVLGEIVGDLPKDQVPINLPIAALAAFMPMVAAAILTYRERGLSGVKGLFAKAIDARLDRIGWYALAA